MRPRDGLAFGALPAGQRDTLTALERTGRLTDQEVSAARATVVVAGAAAKRTIP